jgi:acyl dehydratase
VREMAEKIDARHATVGYRFEPLEFQVTSELNQQYLYGEEDFDPKYIQEDKSGPPLVHPALVLNMSNATRCPSFFLPPGVAGFHTRDQVFFYSPARVGKKLRVTWQVLETYEKRGRPYMLIETRIIDEEGTEIMKRLVHTTFVEQR